MSEPVVADFLEAAWQNVLQEAADELLGGDCHLAIAAAAASAVREGDSAQAVRSRFRLDDPPIADRHAEDVRGQIA